MNHLLSLAVGKYIKDGMKVLELGSGNCKLLRALIDKKPTCEFTAIDLHKPDDFPHQARFIQMNLEEFDLAEKFNVIIMDNVLEHLKNPIGLLEKLRSSLLNNGTLLVAVPNRYGWNNEAKVYFPAHGKHYWLYDRESLQFMLERIRYSVRFHNLYGEENKPLWLQLVSKIFTIQNPVLIAAVFPDVD